jgi:hypothetical protein
MTMNDMDEVKDVVDVEAARRGIRDQDPRVRCDAAVALGSAWIAGVDGLPYTGALLEELARADVSHPGVADAFYDTVNLDIAGESWRDFPPWMLRVLEARRDHRQLDTPVRCNDLEFHAHEVFDHDAATLQSLLAWGYVNTVEMALTHFAISPHDAKSLMTALYREHGQDRWGTALALHYATLLEPVTASWPTVKLDAIDAVMHTCDYAQPPVWTATWIFPQPPAPISALPIDDPAALVGLLVQAGVFVGDQEAVLDHARFERIIPVPTLLTGGDERHTYAPRPDIALDVILDARAGTVIAVRLIRARRHRAP